MKQLTILILVLVLTSCGNLKHSNFNRQKFTDLKTKPLENKDSKIEEDLSANTEYTQTNTEFFEQTNPETDYTNTDVTIDNSDVETESSQTSLEETELLQSEKTITEQASEIIKPKPDGMIIGTRKDFEKLSTHDQNQSILNFNTIFNAGLIMFLLALFFGLAGLFYFYFAFVGLPLIFAMWIMSFVALNKVRRIDLTDQPKKLKNKIRLAQVVCGIGVTVCIVTVVGGVVLLVLWLARAI